MGSAPHLQGVKAAEVGRPGSRTAVESQVIPCGPAEPPRVAESWPMTRVEQFLDGAALGRGCGLGREQLMGRVCEPRRPCSLWSCGAPMAVEGTPL